MIEQCRYCYYFIKNECRKHAPVIIHIDDNVGDRSKWPNVGFHDGCGDFEPKDKNKWRNY